MITWRILPYVLSLLFLTFFFTADVFASEVVRLSSLEWPPYTGKNLMGNGESAQLVRKAYAAVGVKLEITFFPWRRAMRMAESDVEVSGFFPDYYSSKRRGRFVYSNAYGCSHIGLVERKSSPLDWKSISDLKGAKIGVVAGYLNPSKLDAAIFNGDVKADFAPHDESNLLKVARGRIDAAVVDLRVFDYFCYKSNELRLMREALQVNPVHFAPMKLYVVFKNTELGRRNARLLNEGLKKIGITGSSLPCSLASSDNE